MSKQLDSSIKKFIFVKWFKEIYLISRQYFFTTKEISKESPFGGFLSVVRENWMVACQIYRP